MTRVSKELIFYHIPKTGGIWVRKNLTNIGLYHRQVVNTAKDELMPKFYREFNLIGNHSCPRTTTDSDKEGKFSFTFVRHPITWHRSFYSFRLLSGHKKKDGAFPPDCALDFTSYENYIKNVLEMFPGFLSKYYQYYVGEDLKEVDFIGKQESLQEDFIKALDMSGIVYDKNKIDSERENVNYDKIKDQRDFSLSKELEERLLHEERWIINNFYG